VSLGIGPVCRASRKNKLLYEKTENMFASRAEFNFDVDGDILAIHDLGGMKSVANDIENILSDIQKYSLINLCEYKIIYCDSQGIWDGIIFKNNRVSFFSINEREYQKAKEKLLKLK
jgi:hypothetical protein